ncbi:MAG: prepilin-type N-terminal cleavage/methylation domain-containing protein [Acidobacteriia bacterium]|nr:prepilin-type N-terminal cleavage/methylation domain-containing protein [Terriglobia bacterium]
MDLEATVTIQRAATLRRRLNRQQQGFTLLEVLISMFVLTVGLVSMLGVFATAMAATQTAQQDMIAKQLAQQAMETIYTARETANITWDQIQNVGGAGSPGIFRTGLQSIKQVGTDGIMDTINDGASLPQSMTLPGPDGIVGTSDDVTMGLNNYQRSIAIANTPSADLRSVTITVQYTTPRSKFPKTYVLSGFISQYR